MSHPAFVQYPPQAAFGRTIPKIKIYDNGSVSTRLKELFVKQVEQIVWQYKLAPETIHLSARPDVPEIQILQIQIKVPELHHDVLRCIDQAVPFPLIFELAFQDRNQVVAGYKRASVSAAGDWAISEYFSTGWLPAGTERTAMPMALHLGGLYEQLLQRLVPLVPRPQEPLIELVARASRIRSLRSEVAKTVSKLETEKQFNRKVEINSTLRKLKCDLELLGDSQ